MSQTSPSVESSRWRLSRRGKAIILIGILMAQEWVNIVHKDNPLSEISIEQLDQMTRQNIALVQQSAGAAESLRVQAERLQKVVSAFKLLQHTQEAAWTAHSAISGARRSARLGGADAGSGSD